VKQAMNEGPARTQTHNRAAPRSAQGGARFNELAVQAMIPPQLMKALRQVAEHPLGRLSLDEEHALSQLGLLRVWDHFVVVTELGRKLLDDQAE